MIINVTLLYHPLLGLALPRYRAVVELRDWSFSYCLTTICPPSVSRLGIGLSEFRIVPVCYFLCGCVFHCPSGELEEGEGSRRWFLLSKSFFALDQSYWKSDRSEEVNGVCLFGCLFACRVLLRVFDYAICP